MKLYHYNIPYCVNKNEIDYKGLFIRAKRCPTHEEVIRIVSEKKWKECLRTLGTGRLPILDEKEVCVSANFKINNHNVSLEIDVFEVSDL